MYVELHTFLKIFDKQFQYNLELHTFLKIFEKEIQIYLTSRAII